MHNNIIIKNASENNLKQISLKIPRNKFVVITGVSGSGKSSLAFDVIHKESQRRYLQSFSSRARLMMGKLSRPDVESISGLSPSITIDQKTTISSVRSTVGTLTGIHDLLRLLFARFGEISDNLDIVPDRSFFSFNSPKGACNACNGLGVTDKIDPELFITDKNKSIREGALVLSTPTGYLIYSQVTIDVLNDVCKAEGFSVDIPWKDLNDYQINVILYGSEKVKIPFGKHTLESRMKWSGITANPREEGYYKGIIPIMETILKRDRNKNILRFTRSTKCDSCGGSRYNNDVKEVTFRNKTIIELSSLSIGELKIFFDENDSHSDINWLEIRDSIIKKCELLDQLGLGYLNLDRISNSLSGGEAQRIRLSNQAGSKLRGLTYILDEPSIGLHPSETNKLINILKKLRDHGNSVIVVEHDENIIFAADHLIDIGPLAGKLGGELLINCEIHQLEKLKNITNSKTLDFITSNQNLKSNFDTDSNESDVILIKNATLNNLKNLDITFKKGCLNVVSGVSGSGKGSLVKGILSAFLNGEDLIQQGFISEISGIDNISGIIEIDQSPIGRTPRSNPATYTRLSDHIRDLFASLPESKSRNWKKGQFSFNVKGGRCEECEGAGYKLIGMHFLGDAEILCPQCQGKRFKDETLEVKLKGKSIHDILNLEITDALEFFTDYPKIRNILQTLYDLGLGYISPGQSSTTLSGGEAQRIKLASEISGKKTKNYIYILDEPTTGLHHHDIKNLLSALKKLVDTGNTIVAIEHNQDFILSSDHLIELGPGSGKNGGNLLFSGSPGEMITLNSSSLLNTFGHSTIAERIFTQKKQQNKFDTQSPIRLKSVSTNNLKNIDIDIPVNKLTVITGVSGSGKSSLAFDTIFAEGQKMYIENFSSYIRSLTGHKSIADYEDITGLMPGVAINQRISTANPRSTAGTVTDIFEYYRLLFARASINKLAKDTRPLSSYFSFNNQEGACEKCKGLGEITVCDPDKLITYPERSILNGAMDASKTGKFYGDPYGKYIASLLQVGKEHNINFSVPWNDLSKQDKKVALFGTGKQKYSINWNFNRKGREGTHNFDTIWPGLTAYVNEEYERKHADYRGTSMLGIMKQEVCSRCNGTRFKSEVLDWKFNGKSISSLSSLCVNDAIRFFNDILNRKEQVIYEEELSREQIIISESLIIEILNHLEYISQLAIGYISLDRKFSTLSGGEAQRLRLAGMLGSKLTGICYVLDEPTIGLHSTDSKKLISILKLFCSDGNTVVVVEHDKDIIESADHIIEIGPESGENGGKITFSGNFNELIDSDSITGKYLSGKKKVSNNQNQPGNWNKSLKITGAIANNLKNIDIEIPLGIIVSISGKSGTGKSSLAFDVIEKSLKSGKPENCKEFDGLSYISNVITVNKHNIGSTSRGNILTYSGLFDLIRDLFSKTPFAKSNKIKKSHFSTNQKGGRCESCTGQGKIKISMDFLTDVYVTCEECNGKMFKQEIIDCEFKNKSISDILKMSLLELKDFFSSEKRLFEGLNTLCDSGLGYLKAGQSLNTLSGGEQQRLLFAKQLFNISNDRILFILDEPTTGLHFEDINNLLKILNKLVDSGHSVIMVEHNQDILNNSDWIINLGHEGGEGGGYLLDSGIPG